jgi:UDP-N-acetylmuramoyl-tripeptide--D-alanyl-D-alanine ligase
MQTDIPNLYSLYLQHPFISTDTRNIRHNSIFFALKGANFDGNTFAHEALRLGAAYAVVSDPLLTGPGILHVDDTLAALQSLANHHRRQLKIPVLAITGSNGKTTTKELVTAVLSAKYKVHATAGNLNNHIGVPLTLLGVRNDIEFVVCEMGANHGGEIAMLCQIAEPTHGLITNIGKAHLEGFGSVEGVKKAKGELFDYLVNHDGIAFVNLDDANLRELGNHITRKVTYGFNSNPTPQVHFTYSVVEGEAGFRISDTTSPLTIHSSMFGLYNASNMLAAYTIGKHFDVSSDSMVNILAAFIPGANRSERISYKGCTVVKDAYNANPSSMELSVKAFSEQYPNGWIVIGDMKELGEITEEAHLHILQLASRMAFDRIYLVGNAFAQAFENSGITDNRIISTDRIESLKAFWNWEECSGKAILLKGSRSS